MGEAFGLEHLRQVERADPEPGPGRVVIRVGAASLNYRDLLMVRGRYDPKQSLPLVPTSDGVGTITQVGPGVTRVRPGDRVAAHFCQQWLDGDPDWDTLSTTLGGPRDGMLAELAVVDAEGVVPVPDHLSDEEAATLPCAALTAWSALVTLGHAHAGETVLVQGTGGVSIFALQFAKLLGCRVIATSSSDAKIERLRALGADETINYRTEARWGSVARKMTGGRGVDHVIEVGGTGTLGQSIRAVRPGGHIALIGVLAGDENPLNLTPVLMRNIRVQGVFTGHRRSFEDMNRAIAVHGLRPVVDQVFPFEQAPEALAHLASGQHFGKVVVRVAR